jgi:hypothetical protein
MVLALVQNHTMTNKEQNAKIALEMRQHVASWQASKKTSREYCADHGLAVHKLYYWLHKIKKEEAGMDGTATGFLRVRPAEISATAPSHSGSIAPSMEVNLSNGTRFVFYHAISKDLLTVFL